MKSILLFFTFILTCCDNAPKIKELHRLKNNFVQKTGVELVDCNISEYPTTEIRCAGILNKSPINFTCHIDGNCRWYYPKF